MDSREQEYQVRFEYLRSRFNHSLELAKATIAFEHAALRPLYLLNGGAIVAVLAFFGAIAKEQPSVFREMVLYSLPGFGFWAAGLCAAMKATSAGYRSQLSFYKAANSNIRLLMTECGYDSERDKAPDETEQTHRIQAESL